MRLKSFIPLLFSFFYYSAHSQTSYASWKDDTVLRKKFFEESIQKKQALIAASPKQYAKDYKEIYEHQFGEIEDLWKGTRTLTSPEINDYLQASLRKLLLQTQNYNEAMPVLFLPATAGLTQLA